MLPNHVDGFIDLKVLADIHQALCMSVLEEDLELATWVKDHFLYEPTTGEGREIRTSEGFSKLDRAYRRVRLLTNKAQDKWPFYDRAWKKMSNATVMNNARGEAAPGVSLPGMTNGALDSPIRNEQSAHKGESMSAVDMSDTLQNSVSLQPATEDVEWNTDNPKVRGPNGRYMPKCKTSPSSANSSRTTGSKRPKDTVSDTDEEDETDITPASANFHDEVIADEPPTPASAVHSKLHGSPRAYTLAAESDPVTSNLDRRPPNLFRKYKRKSEPVSQEGPKRKRGRPRLSEQQRPVADGEEEE
ncbi:hypothetical protein GQ44DRAFT_568185, partial [Phaeosphaeriaceae sp. PMI808]